MFAKILVCVYDLEEKSVSRMITAILELRMIHLRDDKVRVFIISGVILGDILCANATAWLVFFQGHYITMTNLNLK